MAYLKKGFWLLTPFGSLDLHPHCIQKYIAAWTKAILSQL